MTRTKKIDVKRCQPDIHYQYVHSYYSMRHVVIREAKRQAEDADERAKREWREKGRSHQQTGMPLRPHKRKALFDKYEYGVREYLDLLVQKGEHLEELRNDFLSNYQKMCADEGFFKFLVAKCSSYMIPIEDPTDHFRDHFRVHDIAGFAMFIMYVSIPASNGQDCGPEGANYAKCRYSKKGLVYFLDKHTHCACLDKLAVQAKQMKSIRLCKVCLEEFPLDEMWDCNGCKTLLYCSTDW